MSLEHIEPYIDPAIKDLTKNSRDKLSAFFIVLYREHIQWANYLDDFIIFLKKIEKRDPDLYIYSVYLKFLEKQLNSAPLESLTQFLEKKGYKSSQLSNVLSNKTYNEGAIIKRIPKTNAWFFWLCIFYLYKPRLTQKFFWDKLEYLTTREEAELLSNYRSLPDNLQDTVSNYIQQLADKNKKTPKI